MCRNPLKASQGLAQLTWTFGVGSETDCTQLRAVQTPLLVLFLHKLPPGLLQLVKSTAVACLTAVPEA